MPDTLTLRKPRSLDGIPSGGDSLVVRERYLRKRNRRSRLTDRGLMAVWVGVVALVGWLFVVAFTTLGR